MDRCMIRSSATAFFLGPSELRVQQNILRMRPAAPARSTRGPRREPATPAGPSGGRRRRGRGGQRRPTHAQCPVEKTTSKLLFLIVRSVNLWEARRRVVAAEATGARTDGNRSRATCRVAPPGGTHRTCTTRPSGAGGGRNGGTRARRDPEPVSSEWPRRRTTPWSQTQPRHWLWRRPGGGEAQISGHAWGTSAVRARRCERQQRTDLVVNFLSMVSNHPRERRMPAVRPGQTWTQKGVAARARAALRLCLFSSDFFGFDLMKRSLARSVSGMRGKTRPPLSLSLPRHWVSKK